jgi:hypothetical protein
MVEEPFKHDIKVNLLLSDWYHKSIDSQMVRLILQPYEMDRRATGNCWLLVSKPNHTGVLPIHAPFLISAI